MAARELFSGARFYLSRNLLPPDAIDKLHDVLKQHGAARVNLCCDPSANSPDDFHVLFLVDSDKSRALQDKGCQVLGPQCVFHCAEQRKPVPRRPCTCCLAFEGVRVHATGFEEFFELKAKIEWLVASMCGTLDASISSSTDFVIAKNVACPSYQTACLYKKPIVSLSWLEECARQHQLVSHELHRLPTLSGLHICATQVDVETRMRIAEAANQNGAMYSPDLTKECTHLIANLPDGPKHKASKEWGSIKIVNQDWLWQSLASKACLDEKLFPLLMQTRNDTVAVDNGPESIDNQQASTGPHLSGLGDSVQQQSEAENELYLANCRVYIVGFQADDMKRLVDIVLDGGATRYIELNKTVTHIVLGTASDSELKNIQRGTAGGATQTVSAAWLEECAQKRREVEVTSVHAPSSHILQGYHQKPHRVQSLNFVPATADIPQKDFSKPDDTEEPQLNVQGIFYGLTFAILENPSLDKEVVDKIKSAGGRIDDVQSKADYLIGFHGSQHVLPSNPSATVVSIHWLQQCLLEGKILDSQGHVLYRPLPCEVPLPGFTVFRLCISQYEEKDRMLCGHLCGLLGAKFSNKLSRRVTHLLCKTGGGEKFEGATLLGIPVVAIEWLYACVNQNAVVSLERYRICSQSGRSSAEGSQWVATQKCRSEGNNSGKRKLSSSRSSDASKRPAAGEESCFDEWEVLTASWSKTGAENLSMAKDAGQYLSQLGGETDDTMSPQPDVAAAIENLLAKTTKAKEEGDRSGDEENAYDLLPETTVKEKGLPLPHNLNIGGSPVHENDVNVVSNGKYHLYEESQIESQIVAYDEDHSGKQMIMERVRAGSVTNSKCRRVPKNVALGRLFQAAEANK